ncbi:MAG TPA: nitroreductase family deazaflavin-dependent oxidoreductase [Pseudomonadales bacterium]|nr:nitroreductase family deazaflavin-dependent oxidoreductase [Pseudomonadales bacterium]
MSRIIEPEDIPEHLPEWIRDHMKEYVTSGGTKGHIWRGVPTLLLKTTGHKSGRTGVLPLIYGTTHSADGREAWVVVASKGGAPAHPAWYLNLQAQPQATVQVGEHLVDVRARTAEGGERAELWQQMTGIWPAYDDYRKATDREIPVVVLERR